jgi:uncharacterized membrane protein YeaQ/YmgE (transglycosylase-associated protein family)
MVGLIVMRGGGYGALRDIIVGIVAAFIGGIVMSFLGVHGQAGFFGSVIIAFIGAVMLIAVVGALAV